MSGNIDVGALRERVEVLECRESAPGVWTWETVRKAWAGVTRTEQSNLFSKVGVGARDAALVVRRQGLTLHNALRWKGLHLFLTSIIERGRNFLELHAAVVETATLTAKPQDKLGRDDSGQPAAVPQSAFTFPGVLTERYTKNAPEEAFWTLEQQRVLVTPKAILLHPGDLVRQGGETAYTVRQALDLDPYKNEYILERTESGLLLNHEAYLIGVTTVEDSAGYETATETRTKVFVAVPSVRRAEFYRGRQAGTETELTFVLHARDYSGQGRIEYEGTRYTILRAEAIEGRRLELRCAPYRGETP